MYGTILQVNNDVDEEKTINPFESRSHWNDMICGCCCPSKAPSSHNKITQTRWATICLSHYTSIPSSSSSLASFVILIWIFESKPSHVA